MSIAAAAAHAWPGVRSADRMRRAEDWLVAAVLLVMTLLPIAEAVSRRVLDHGLPGSFVLTQQLTLWVALLGAALAARSGRLLALATPALLPDRWRARVTVVTSAVGAGIAAALVLASLDFVSTERQAGEVKAWGIPAWVLLTVLPAGFGAIAARLIWHAGASWRDRGVALIGLLIPLMFWHASSDDARLVSVAAVGLVVATSLGMPLFATIGGAALLLYWADGTPISAVPLETYRLTTSELLPAIPLFALSGYILAEGGASRRLTRFFIALIGWVPGGLAVAVTAVLAFFTPLTGASGVTILSMGGVLSPVLVQSRYPEHTSLGLVTVAGSIGLLFFPSLPVFMYGFYTNQEFERLFAGGLVPGLLLVAVVAGHAAVQGWRGDAVRVPFSGDEAMRAVWHAKWDVAFPAVVLGTIVIGFASGLLEAAALGVVYALCVECLVHRTLRLSRDLVRIAVECATLVGGFLIILSVALAFTNFLVLADVPTRAVAWVRAHVDSPWVFLLTLNVILLCVGALMDIYSAIVVIVPLVAPMAAAYGIDPVHLGVIFLANMELGYLMPPMGENLFLSAYRFGKPLSEVCRAILPYAVILAGAVLVITYVPGLTLWLVGLYDRMP